MVLEWPLLMVLVASCIIGSVFAWLRTLGSLQGSSCDGSTHRLCGSSWRWVVVGPAPVACCCGLMPWFYLCWCGRAFTVRALLSCFVLSCAFYVLCSCWVLPCGAGLYRCATCVPLIHWLLLSYVLHGQVCATVLWELGYGWIGCASCDVVLHWFTVGCSWVILPSPSTIPVFFYILCVRMVLVQCWLLLMA